MLNILEQKMKVVQQELNYIPLLDSCIKRVLEENKPHPSECSLDYLYNHGVLEKIHVKIRGYVVSIVVCGKVVDSDNPLVLNYIKPYEIVVPF